MAGQSNPDEIIMNLASGPIKKKPIIKKDEKQTPVSSMITETLKRLEKNASANMLLEEIGRKYPVNVKALKPHILSCIKEKLKEGVIQKSDGIDGMETFKIKKGVDVKTKKKSTPKGKGTELLLKKKEDLINKKKKLDELKKNEKLKTLSKINELEFSYKEKKTKLVLKKTEAEMNWKKNSMDLCSKIREIDRVLEQRKIDGKKHNKK